MVSLPKNVNCLGDTFLDFKNLKINFLGDSITEGTGASTYDNCYVKIIEKKTGAICRNYGIGGTRIARQNNPSDTPIFDKDFCSRINEMDHDTDVVVVFGGTNDFGHGDAHLGAFGDSTPNTFFGALDYLYRNLIKEFPKSLIIAVTPLHREKESITKNDIKGKSEKCFLRDYVYAIRKVANKYSIPILDLYADSVICPSIDSNKYTVDGLHPNDSGHQIIASMVIDFIKSKV